MCGFNGTMPLFPVKTLQVAAGSTIGFAASYMADSRKEEQDFSEVRTVPQEFYQMDIILKLMIV
jgi:hypothetical protein